MIPGNILSLGLQVEAYCPPGNGAVPGVPERAYQPPVRTYSLRRQISYRMGKLLIAMGERLAYSGQPCGQWVEEMT
jgi:hypothetical protein